MSNSIPAIEAIERAEKRNELPMFRAGDTIRVHALISEGNKERIQVFEGVCIHRKRGGGRGSFTVRKVSSSHGVGVERVWPENSPRVTKVELVNRGKVRRAKLYYLRELRGNAARITSKLGGYGAILARQAEKQARYPDLVAFASYRLIPMLHGMGAYVVTVRESDVGSPRVIVDDADATLDGSATEGKTAGTGWGTVTLPITTPTATPRKRWPSGTTS